jgi:hypothetical protein
MAIRGHGAWHLEENPGASVKGDLMLSHLGISYLGFTLGRIWGESEQPWEEDWYSN